jgi:hypothetical protein
MGVVLALTVSLQAQVSRWGEMGDAGSPSRLMAVSRTSDARIIQAQPLIGRSLQPVDRGAIAPVQSVRKPDPVAMFDPVPAHLQSTGAQPAMAVNEQTAGQSIFEPAAASATPVVQASYQQPSIFVEQAQSQVIASPVTTAVPRYDQPALDYSTGYRQGYTDAAQVQPRPVYYQPRPVVYYPPVVSTSYVVQSGGHWGGSVHYSSGWSRPYCYRPVVHHWRPVHYGHWGHSWGRSHHSWGRGHYGHRGHGSNWGIGFSFRF